MANNITITGLNEVKRKLATLETKVQKKVLRQELRDIAKTLATQEKANAPVDKGDLTRSIKVKSSKRKKGQMGVAVVAANLHAAAQEFGAEGHNIKGTHFAERAFDAKKQGIVESTAAKIKARIEAEAAK